MGHVNLNTLFYPGEKSCRIACPLRTYHEVEMQEACGWECSYFHPKPPIVTEIATPAGKKEKKGQSDVSSKKSKSSKTDKKSKTKGKNDHSVGVNLIEVLAKNCFLDSFVHIMIISFIYPSSTEYIIRL